MVETTVCYLLKDGEVLLGLKKRGFGLKKYTGIGGKLEAGETPAEATIREMQEETGVTLVEEDLVYRGIIHFFFPGKPEWNIDMHVFTAETWQGTPVEGAEVRPMWFGLDELPLGEMWDDARLWLPHVLAGGKINATFLYNDDNDTIDEDTSSF